MKMQNLKKKGFTLVELVIVIAVVAILAAVLIPSFASLIKKANQSADQQAVVQMNKLLVLDEVSDQKPQTTDDVVEILIKNGYSDSLTPYYSGYKLAWLKDDNVIVLVENNAVVFPEDYKGATNYQELSPMISNVEDLLEALEAGKTVFVSSDIVADGLSATAAGEYAVNLTGNKLNSSSTVGSWVEGGKLVITDGAIEATVGRTAVLAKAGGTVELNNVQVYTQNGVNPLQCYGGTMILNNVVSSQSGSIEGNEKWYDSAVQVINTIQQQEDGKYQIYGQQATLVINGGMYSGKKAIQISAPGGNVTINSGNFIGTEQVINADFAPQNYRNSEGYESVITINGGTFNGNIKISAATVLIINGGTFTINPSTIQNVTINGTVVDNGNGTWTVRK